MKLLRILTLLTAGTGLLALPARADDHDKDKKHNKHSEQYYHDHHAGVSVGVGEGYRHSYGSSTTVIIGRDRPYYGHQGYGYGYSTGYAGHSVEIDIQSGLARRGYYRGPIDGDIGPGSRASIRAYQADHGFAPTGRIDHALIISLR